MIEFSLLNATQVISLVLMGFFIGLRLDGDERTKDIASKAQWASLAILWICVLIK